MFYKYINLFGLGQKTGIDLPGEASGIVNDINKVHNVELANIVVTHIDSLRADIKERNIILPSK